MTLTGSAMFIGLMVGGVLADRYERKSDPAGAWYLWHWLYWPVFECVTSRTVVTGNLSAWLMGRFLCFAGCDCFAGSDASAGRAGESDAGRGDYHADGASGIGNFADAWRVLLATGGVASNYGLAAAGTFITLLPLLSLPALPPPPQPREHPLKSLLAAFRFLLASPLIGGIALLGGLLTMASAVRVLYPALAINWHMSSAQIGLLYAAIPLGQPWVH